MSFVDFFQRMVDYAFQRGILLVAAAGNSAEDFNTATSPAGSYVDSLNAPAGLHHVLTLARRHHGPGELQHDRRVFELGDDGAAVFAPGGNSADTVQADLVIGAAGFGELVLPGDGEQLPGGRRSSFASPLVAGEAAVVQGQSTTVAGQRSRRVSRRRRRAERHGSDPNYGFGVVNVLSAVNKELK